MSNYSACTDIDLQQRAVSGDRKAEEELALRYSRLVKICARQFYIAGGDSEDLTQEGMLGLLSAIRDYDSSMNTSFKTYAELCIKRRLLTAIRAASRKKHAPLNDGVSLDSIYSDESLTHAAFFQEAFRRIPEEQVLARESADEFFTTYVRCLSDFEREVLSLNLCGLSVREMAICLGRTHKSVDNAAQRIRSKLARFLDLGDLSG